MADVFTPTKRSEVMSRIRSRGNKETELALLSILRLNRITGWRRHAPLLGKPDFTFPKVRLVIFVDGCFWHGCPRCYRRPRSSTSYWDSKLSRNRQRDRQVTRTLRREGWKVIRIWQHQLKQTDIVALKIHKILRSS